MTKGRNPIRRGSYVGPGFTYWWREGEYLAALDALGHTTGAFRIGFLKRAICDRYDERLRRDTFSAITRGRRP